MNEIIIFGVGGVGSWLANFLSRYKNEDGESIYHLTLVDDDRVEEKNLVRQNFFSNHIGISKVHTPIITNYENPTKLIDERITDDEQLFQFNPDHLAILCTDNLKSKLLISSYFNKFLIVNCDKDYVEVKNHIDKETANAWDMGGGYQNGQNLNSNIKAVSIVLDLITKKAYNTDEKFGIITKVESSTIDLLKWGEDNDEI